MDVAERIAQAIEVDLRDRPGMWVWDLYDYEIIEEIRATWHTLILDILQEAEDEIHTEKAVGSVVH